MRTSRRCRRTGRRSPAPPRSRCRGGGSGGAGSPSDAPGCRGHTNSATSPSPRPHRVQGLADDLEIARQQTRTVGLWFFFLVGSGKKNRPLSGHPEPAGQLRKSRLFASACTCRRFVRMQDTPRDMAQSYVGVGPFVAVRLAVRECTEDQPCFQVRDAERPSAWPPARSRRPISCRRDQPVARSSTRPAPAIGQAVPCAPAPDSTASERLAAGAPVLDTLSAPAAFNSFASGVPVGIGGDGGGGRALVRLRPALDGSNRYRPVSGSGAAASAAA